MHTPHRSSSLYTTLYKFTLLVALGWTLSVAGSLFWNRYDEHQQAMVQARNEARSNFNKDLAFRSWATKHGGVYVPLTEDTPSNPYLKHIPDRDITLPSGKKLTLMNPAYMMRQIMEDYTKQYGIKGHITSLKPLNPVNEPDAWERNALVSFEQGKSEAMETIVIDGRPYLRLMRPLLTAKGCLKCHAEQGYREGDIRGGIGISLPLEGILVGERRIMKNTLLTHGFIWLLGMSGILIFMFQGKKGIVERGHAEDALQQSEEKYRTLFEESFDGLFITSPGGKILDMNRKGVAMFGYDTKEEIYSLDLERDVYADPGERKRVLSQINAKGAAEYEVVVKKKNGDRMITHCALTAVKDQGGAITSYRGIIRDITDRKKAEDRLARIVQTIPDLLFVIDREGTFLDVKSPRPEDLYIPPDKIIGRKLQDIFSPELSQLVMNNISRVLETRQNSTFEYSLPLPEGKGDYEANMGLYGAEEVIVVVRNITERRKTEEVILKLNADLEQRVKARTAELEVKNNELERMNRMFVGRELRMAELKEKIAELEKNIEALRSSPV